MLTVFKSLWAILQPELNQSCLQMSINQFCLLHLINNINIFWVIYHHNTSWILEMRLSIFPSSYEIGGLKWPVLPIIFNSKWHFFKEFWEFQKIAKAWFQGLDEKVQFKVCSVALSQKLIFVFKKWTASAFT